MHWQKLTNMTPDISLKDEMQFEKLFVSVVQVQITVHRSPSSTTLQYRRAHNSLRLTRMILETNRHPDGIWHSQLGLNDRYIAFL